MTTAYSTNLGLALPVEGELSGTWGDMVNNGITQYSDIAIAGTQTISGTQTAVTLSLTNGNSSATNIAQVGSGATGSAQFAIINCTGAPVSTLTVTVPASSRQYIVINATSTSQAVKVVGVGPTTGVTIAAERAAHIAWNGADFTLVATTDASKLSGVLAVANGGTGLSSGTSGGVLYYSGPTTLASSAALSANALVIGGGAGVAPSTTTTGTGVVTAVGNAVNTSGGLVTQSGTLTASAVLLGGGSGTAIASTTTGTGVVTAVGNAVNTSGGLVTQSGTLAASALLLGGGSGTAISSTTTGSGVVTALGNAANATGGFATINGAATLTNKRIDPRVSSTTSTSSITPDISSYDQYCVTAQAATLTINAPIGTPVDGDKLIFRILDNGTSQTLSWNATFTAIGVTLPTATTISKTTYVGCIYNANNTRWDVVAATTQA